MSNPAVDQSDLMALLARYSEVTERLQRSHDLLARQVCRLRERLQEQDRELQRRERLAALGQMAAGVAHEIRNPLGGVQLYASLLQRDLHDRPEQQELVRKLSVGVHHVESIVTDILAFAGDGEPNRRPVPLSRIIEDVLIQVGPQARSRGIYLVVEPVAGDPPLLCDRGQIQRALINLILNGLDAAEGQVWIRWDRGHLERGLLGIVVEDDGPGIEPALAQRVFDPFFTTKDTGTGLGLAIVHRIAESNGGSVRAGGRSGGGASFMLSVPLAESRPASQTARSDGLCRTRSDHEAESTSYERPEPVVLSDPCRRAS